MARKTCEECQIRPVGGGKSSGHEDVRYNREHGSCNPCGDLAQMWNSHHNGHESIPEDECWLCHPEMDETQREYAERSGTSRAGMVINVPIRAQGWEKALVTAGSLGLNVPQGTFAAIKKSLKEQGAVLKAGPKSILVELVYGELSLTWESNGRFISGAFAGRKIRNVAEALRVSRC